MMMDRILKKITLLCLVAVSARMFLSWAEDPTDLYRADISAANPAIISGHLKLGSNKAPNGNVLEANSLYFTRNGKPRYPVMGEFHFSRYPKAQWEESILKMKAAGIDVIATYVFWIYHEEEEGRFNWTGNNDLRAFAELCKKNNVFLFTRIGPWCHGEVRNGGFPDWIVKRGNMRKNNAEYLASVQKLYNEVGKQLNGLYFKDGGPVIGTQIENEFRFNNAAGLEHMYTLKKMSVQAGIDVPFYTATGWPGSNQEQDELLPVWGAYPEAPWDKKTTKLKLSENYVFGTLRNDPAIGSDLLGKQDEVDFKGYRYPYATAEMGAGNQVTYHRRPIITPDDVTSLAYIKIGSGANLMGYYMFHGGSNPVGKLTTLQESKATNYPNDYPIISYDFLSPIGEWGQLRPSYRNFKTIHTFLNEYGSRLAGCYAYFPDRKPGSIADNRTLRFSVRSKNNSGFVFISNYQRQLEMQDIKNVKFSFKLAGGQELSFPGQPVTIQKGLQAVLPFNMDIEGANLKYATVQPFCRLEGAIPTYVFFAPAGIRPEYVFDGKGISAVSAVDGNAQKTGPVYVVSNLRPGTNCVLELTLASGKKVRALTLNNEQALDAWKADVYGAERLFISKQDLVFPKDAVRLQSTGQSSMSFSVYPAAQVSNFDTSVKVKRGTNGIFEAYSISIPAKPLTVSYKEISDIGSFLNKGPQLPADDRNAKNLPVSPGPQYQTNLTPVKGAKYYQVDITSPYLSGLGDAFLAIDYTGDTGALYLDGKLIADDFYSGLPFRIGLKRFGPQLRDKKLLLQVVPLTDERQIFFEDGIREPLRGREAASVRSVKLEPQYQLLVNRRFIQGSLP